MSSIDHVMAAADVAKKERAAADMLEEIERTWQTEDGPPTPYIEWSDGFSGVGTQASEIRSRVVYVSAAFGCSRHSNFSGRYLGHRRLSVLVEWFPDSIRQWVAKENHDARLDAATRGLSVPPAITPETHKIMWRARPEVNWDTEMSAWLVYARFAFVPIGANLITDEAS